MDLIKAIRVFDRVVQLQSFSAAARELDQVNSAVSRQISELEQHLNCKLLNRTTRAMSLTAEGEYYLQRFQHILDSVDQLNQDVVERSSLVSGKLTITAPMHADRFLGLQQRLSGFLAQYPEVKLNWLSANRFVNLVEEGIDLAIRVGKLEDSGLIARPLGEMKVYFVASQLYLDKQGAPSRIEDLKQHRCILDSSNRQPGRWSYAEGKHTRHIVVPGSLLANNGEMVAAFAADHLGIACLPDFLLQPYLDQGRLVRVLSDYEIDPVPVSMVYPANRLQSPALKALISWLLT